MNRQQRRAHSRRVGRALDTTLTICRRPELKGHTWQRPWQMLRDDTGLPIGFYETREQAETAARSSKLPYEVQDDGEPLTTD